MATYTFCWVEFPCWSFNQTKQLPTLCAGVALSLLLLMESNLEHDYLHCVLASRRVQFRNLNVNQKAATYTLRWCRTGSSYDVELLTKRRPPTLCAGVALGPILMVEFEIESGNTHFALASHCIWFDIELQEKATMVPGVALGQHWIVDFQCKSGDLHSVLVSHWI